KAKDRGMDEEKLAQALSFCLAGLFFFPNQDDVLDQEHLGTIQSACQGRSVAQAVLAYLYNGLSSTCLGGPFYGRVILLDIWFSFHLKMDFGVNESDNRIRSYERRPIFRIKDALHYSDKMAIKTLHVHNRTEWRRFLASLPCSEFIFSSEVLAELKI